MSASSASLPFSWLPPTLPIMLLALDDPVRVAWGKLQATQSVRLQIGLRTDDTVFVPASSGPAPLTTTGALLEGLALGRSARPPASCAGSSGAAATARLDLFLGGAAASSGSASSGRFLFVNTRFRLRLRLLPSPSPPFLHPRRQFLACLGSRTIISG
ncbi:hypothetical protein B0H14DRAFT_3857420 [Mycena olivaceomarginata]|nr:hypothetical protein B0H14DRAFT_3857420 [Mycena olivaceomarginata]